MSQEIDDVFGDVTIYCDTCDNEWDFPSDGEYVNFKEMNQSLKEDGWRIYKQGGDWCHKCHLCIENKR